MHQLLHAGEHSHAGGPDLAVLVLAILVGLAVTTTAFYWLRFRR